MKLGRTVRHVGLALAVASCGPGSLGDPSFGTAADANADANADEIGELGESSSGSTADSAATDTSPESTASSGADEASTSGTESSTDASSSNTDTSSTGTDTSSAGTDTSSAGTDTSSATASDSTASASEDSSASASEDGNWGTPPDVTNEPCNPLAQDCFFTHKCVPYATVPGSSFLDADKCMPIVGDKGWGEPCTLSDFNEAQDDCDGEGFCWNLEWIQGELHGTCVPFCTGSPQDLMCPPGWGCLFSGAVALCSKQCNPLLQDCPDPYNCYWINDAFQCALTGSFGQDAQPCNQANDCTPGLGCVAKANVPGCPDNAATCCTPYCDLDTPDCQAGRDCVAFFGLGEAPPGFEDVGLCLAP